jgi:peroxiredoxin
MKIRAQEKAFNFPYLIDEGQKVYPKFGAKKTPHVFILEKRSGDLVLVYKGAIDDNHEFPKQVKEKYVETVLNELAEAKKELTYTETKAIGCSIKDKSKEEEKSK